MELKALKHLKYKYKDVKNRQICSAPFFATLRSLGASNLGLG